MRVKNVNLEWNVMIESFNRKDVITYNIFNQEFVERLHKKILKKEVTDYNGVKEEIKRWGMYHYWSKCEFEIAVGGLFSKHPDEFEKIDAWHQVEINLDRVTEYVIRELKIDFKGRKNGDR